MGQLSDFGAFRKLYIARERSTAVNLALHRSKETILSTKKLATWLKQSEDTHSFIVTHQRAESR